MRLSFDSIDEVRDFVKGLKGARGGKAGDDDGAAGATGGQTAPPPLNPPGGGPAFNPGGAAAFNPPGGVAFNPSAVAPEVQALIARIATRIDGAIASGQPADQVLAWFRGQCGAEAANATMDQVKTVFLPKAALPTLENIAKLMNA